MEAADSMQIGVMNKEYSHLSSFEDELQRAESYRKMTLLSSRIVRSPRDTLFNFRHFL